MNERKLARTLKVLVVDDSIVVRSLLRHVLPEWGYSVICLADGESALKMIQTQRFDVILLDVELPGMGGVEVTKKVRRLPGEVFNELAIIGMTAHEKVTVKEQLCAAGMNGVLSKPFTRPEFERG